MADKDSVFEFPCSYPLKVVGKNTNEFYSVVISVIERHVGRGNEVRYSSRVSSGRKYMSITAAFLAESEEQLNRIYSELNGNELVVMTL